MTTENEEKLIKIIKTLVEKVRLYHEKYGSEYLGGVPFQFILQEIKDMNIEIDIN